ncbi:hypothetical protein QFZ89_004645 [Paraburkholderia youngii]
MGTRYDPLCVAAWCRFDSGTRPAATPAYSNLNTKGDDIMPYLIGWLLGVPLIVLIILYLIFH